MNFWIINSNISSRGKPDHIHPFADKIVGLLLEFMEMDDDELKESCLLFFEMIISTNPHIIFHHFEVIFLICLKYITHDPNYENDDDEDEDMDKSKESERYINLSGNWNYDVVMMMITVTTTIYLGKYEEPHTRLLRLLLMQTILTFKNLLFAYQRWSSAPMIV